MKPVHVSVGLGTCLLLGGCTPPVPVGSYVGTAKDTDWPYRYTLTQKSGLWSGTIEYHRTNGWVFWDAMEIVEQEKSRIKFKARLDDKNSIRAGWYLLLENVSSQGFAGDLAGDVFPGNRVVRLSFTPAITEPSGPANRSQPVGSDTNRTSAAAGSGR